MSTFIDALGPRRIAALAAAAAMLPCVVAGATTARVAAATIPPVAAASAAPLAAGAARTTLEAYLAAIIARRYDRAFVLLSADGRRYFETAANYASIFESGGLAIERARIRSATVTARGTVARVDETTKYVDDATQSVDEADGSVLYGIVPEGRGFRIKDPYHPWKALAPADATAVAGEYRITVRKISFFTGRLELVVTFENRGSEAVTMLPNRTILRDDRGNVLHCLIDPAQPFTDRQLRLGLRLAANSRYTGALAFASQDRYRPRTLALSAGPFLVDGADRPFAIDVRPLVVSH